MIKIDIAVVEIGSTVTKLNAFSLTPPEFLGKGIAPTTVLEGDVQIGIDRAIRNYCEKYGETEFGEILATSSAAGGLKMTVHGLTKSMTVRAAQEASLGAGAVLHYVTSGLLRRFSAKKIEEIKPNIIFLAGGVEGGDCDTTLENADILASLDIQCPVIFAGNSVIAEEIHTVFSNAGKKIHIVDNVYPDVDELNIAPARRVIQDVFSEHILHAPGMEKIGSICRKAIFPVPAMVLRAAELAAEMLSQDVLVVDVGGATTDVHSVCRTHTKYSDMMIEPEPDVKRTVEGDLGVFVNARRVADISAGRISDADLQHLKPIPSTPEEKQLSEQLAELAVVTGVKRHAGALKELFTATGKKSIVRGKDLTEVKMIIGSGGALTQLEHGENLLGRIRIAEVKDLLLPGPDAKITIDRNYLMSSVGVLACFYEDAACEILKKYILSK